MVANLSANKKGWEDRWEEFSSWAVKGQQYKKTLLDLVDEDTLAFKAIMNAFGLPKSTDAEKKARTTAIQDATKYAIEVPLKVMETAFNSMEVLKAMAENGLEASVSDAGVGALCARSAVLGAFLNVKINLATLKDNAYIKSVTDKGMEIRNKAIKSEEEILKICEKRHPNGWSPAG